MDDLTQPLLDKKSKLAETCTLNSAVEFHCRKDLYIPFKAHHEVAIAVLETDTFLL
jgi:hypothetical protein